MDVSLIPGYSILSVQYAQRIFGRDQRYSLLGKSDVGITVVEITAYPSSHVPPHLKEGDVLCRACYVNLFSIGVCQDCKGSITGDREEGYNGAHVKGRAGELWHARCFICSGWCDK
jgi:hypothetical protein